MADGTLEIFLAFAFIAAFGIVLGIASAEILHRSLHPELYWDAKTTGDLIDEWTARIKGWLTRT